MGRLKMEFEMPIRVHQVRTELVVLHLTIKSHALLVPVALTTEVKMGLEMIEAKASKARSMMTMTAKAKVKALEVVKVPIRREATAAVGSMLGNDGSHAES